MDVVIKHGTSLYLILNGVGWGISTHLRLVANVVKIRAQLLHLKGGIYFAFHFYNDALNFANFFFILLCLEIEELCQWRPATPLPEQTHLPMEVL